MRISVACLIVLMALASACGTRRPVYASTSALKANSGALARGNRIRVETTDGKSFAVAPETKARITVYGPVDEGGGRPARVVNLSLQEFASDCLANTPCLLDQSSTNRLRVGTRSTGDGGLTSYVLSMMLIGAVGGVCVSGVCGETLELASGPLLVVGGIMGASLVAIRFAR